MQTLPRIPRWSIVLFAILFVLATPRVRGWNEANRLALTQSLVENRQFQINDSPFIDTGDKVLIHGNYYSEKPPLPALMAALVFTPLRAVGLELNYGWNLAYFIIILLTVKTIWFMGLYAFWRSLAFTGINHSSKLFVLLALAFGSLALTWSSTLNNHLMSAALLAVGYYFWLMNKQTGRGQEIMLSGFAFLMAASMDLPTGSFYASFLVALLLQRRPIKQVLLFLLPVTVTVIPYLTHNYLISGSILPFQWHLEFFDFPGSHWVREDRLVNSFGEAFLYSLGLLFGAKGFILYNPLLIPALIGLARVIKRKDGFKPEALVVSSASLIMLLFYAFYTDNFSGDSYSVRWFIPLLPALNFFLFAYLQDASKKQMVVFRVLFGLSVTIAVVGLINPWSDVSLHNAPFVANLLSLSSMLR